MAFHGKNLSESGFEDGCFKANSNRWRFTRSHCSATLFSKKVDKMLEVVESPPLEVFQRQVDVGLRDTA